MVTEAETIEERFIDKYGDQTATDRTGECEQPVQVNEGNTVMLAPPNVEQFGSIRFHAGSSVTDTDVTYAKTDKTGDSPIKVVAVTVEKNTYYYGYGYVEEVAELLGRKKSDVIDMIETEYKKYSDGFPCWITDPDSDYRIVIAPRIVNSTTDDP